MATKKRKDMYDPIPGTVICKGHLHCQGRETCPHGKLHKWILFTEKSEIGFGCYCSPEHASICNCIPMTKEGLLLEAY